MKIKSVRITDFKGLSFAQFDPDDHIVAIYGKNGAGKSSVLDAIFAAIAGSSASPDVPIRHGCSEAECSVELSDGMKVTRRWTSSGKTTLEVTNQYGYKQDRPQETLSALFSKVCFDPISFCDMHPKDQARELISLAGEKQKIDEINKNLSEIERERKSISEEIREISGKIESLFASGAIAINESDKDIIPEDRKKIDLISEKLEESRNKIEEETFSLAASLESVRRAKEEIEEKKRQIEILESKVAMLDSRIFESRSSIDNERELSSALSAQLGKAKVEASVNRHNAIFSNAEIELSYLKDRSSDLLSESKRLNREKTSLAKSANDKIGLVGLEFTEDGVTYCGMPTSVISSAEKIKVGIFIGELCEKPLRVTFARDASLLDEGSMQELFDFAKDKDVQIWIERVGSPESDSVIFVEDGNARDTSKKSEFDSVKKKDLDGQLHLFDIEEDNPF